MVHYRFDVWGWYVGEADAPTATTTDIAPPDTDGNRRPYWTGADWVLREYVAPPPLPAQTDLAQAKAQRQAEVEAIKVTTSAGNTFDGDEVSQGRMSRAVIGLSAMPGATINWVLADNTIIEATAAELVEALALAGAKQGEIWVRPYQ